MKKKIKIIDLLNRIANGEELPKKIEYANMEYTLSPKKNYWNGYDRDLLAYVDSEDFNDEVEILDEDEFEDIEEIEHEYIYGLNENEEKIDDRVSRFEDKINALIKNQKKIIERLNNQDNN